MSRTRYRFHEYGATYFVTCTVVGWLPVFTRPSRVEILLDSLRFLQSKKRITLFAFVVLENHLHLIASAADASEEIGDFKSFTARKVIDSLRETGDDRWLDLLSRFKKDFKTDQTFQLWQEGSHPKQIVGDEMMEQKMEYLHANPVRRGYVDLPEEWRYSSARNYTGRPGLIDVTTDWR